MAWTSESRSWQGALKKRPAFRVQSLGFRVYAECISDKNLQINRETAVSAKSLLPRPEKSESRGRSGRGCKTHGGGSIRKIQAFSIVERPALKTNPEFRKRAAVLRDYGQKTKTERAGSQTPKPQNLSY